MRSTSAFLLTSSAPHSSVAPLLTSFCFCISLGSLGANCLTNYGEDISGVIKLSEALKENKALTSLKCVPQWFRPFLTND